jgi:hypothetical protein
MRRRLAFTALLLISSQLLHAQSTEPSQRRVPTGEQPVSISPVLTEKIEQLLTVTGTRATVTKMLDNGKKSLSSYADESLPPASPNASPVVQLARKQALDAYHAQVEIISESSLTWDHFKPTLIQFCAQNFSPDEIDAILAFYRSPAGKAMLTKAPQIGLSIESASDTARLKVRHQLSEAQLTYSHRVNGASEPGNPSR